MSLRFVLLASISLLVCSCMENSKLIQPDTFRLDRSDYPAAPDSAEAFADTANIQNKNWVNQECALYEEYMSKVTYHDSALNRLRTLCNYQRISNITCAGKRYLYSIADGDDAKIKVYIQETLNREPEILFDPTVPFEGRTISMKSYDISPNGRWMTMQINAGENTDEIIVWDLETRRVVKEECLTKVKTKACWAKMGFFYGMFRGGLSNKDSDESMMVMYHHIGTPVSDDQVVVEPVKGREFWYNMRCFKGSEDSQTYLFLLPKGDNNTKGNNLLMSYRDEQGNSVLKTMHDGGDNEKCFFVPIAMIGDTIFMRTNFRAPNGRIVCCTVDRPEEKDWWTVIPENDDPLISCSGADGHLIMVKMHNGAHQTIVYDTQGKQKCTVAVPDFASVQFKSDMLSRDIFYTVNSFVRPMTMYKYDMKTNTSFRYLDPKSHFNPDDYITERFMVRTEDGMHVPLFITRRKDVKLSEDTPCFFTSHGAMGVLSVPKFDPSMLLVLEQGGIMATGVCRGGGEYGDLWHKIGMGLVKENTFIDYRSMLRFMIDNKMTSPERLAVYGRGLGCLNIAVMANRNPELFSVALMNGPFLDVLNLERYGRAAIWGEELGFPDQDSQVREYMKKYAPLQNLKPGQYYPAVLSIAHTNDKQIPSLHTKKYISALQNMDSGENTKLAWLCKGTGKELQKNEEFSSLFCFAWFNWDLPYKLKK